MISEKNLINLHSIDELANMLIVTDVNANPGIL